MTNERSKEKEVKGKRGGQRKTNIINSSLVTGIVPFKSKIAKIISILENGQHDDM